VGKFVGKEAIEDESASEVGSEIVEDMVGKEGVIADETASEVGSEVVEDMVGLETGTEVVVDNGEGSTEIAEDVLGAADEKRADVVG